MALDLPSKEIPQANNVGTLFAIARQVLSRIVEGESLQDACCGLPWAYIAALRILGALEPSTEGRALLQDLGSAAHIARAAFESAFGRSAVGLAWCNSEGVQDVRALIPESAARFLATCENLAPSTAQNRTRCLMRWCEYIRSPIDQSVPVGFPREQLWPVPDRFPHNVNGASVRDVLRPDLRTGPVLIVAGYAALREMIPFLGEREVTVPGEIRVVLGVAPFTYRRGLNAPSDVVLDYALRDRWLERKVSITQSAAIIRLRERIASREILTRLTYDGDFNHSKIYVSEFAATVGSSNFTTQGFATQVEANVRFEVATRRFG